MVWNPHSAGYPNRNPCYKTQNFLHLFHLCHRGLFLSHLPRIGVFPMDKRYFHHEKTQCIRFMTLQYFTPDYQSEIEEIWNAYFQTFPPEERRKKEHFHQALQHEKCKLFGIFHEKQFVGYAICWVFQDFTFLEHFEIFQSFRNQKLGSKTLQALQSKFQNIILESEPSTHCEIAHRRIDFYCRNHFQILDEKYWQPPYSPEQTGINLWLMANFNPKSLQDCVKNIYQTVYNFE